MGKDKIAKKQATPPKFKVGDEVRVKHGVRDTDYPDVPLGGWAGMISKVHGKGSYDVRWSQETLANIHPVIKKRCEKDGLVLEEYGLGEDDLEADAGGPLEMEQPIEIVTKPLSPKDQDDRIRMVFGLTSNDPLPEVDDDTLVAYHKYLVANLTFPIEAEHGAEYGHPENVKVLGLGDPDEEPMIDGEEGILCEARMEGYPGKPGELWFVRLCPPLLEEMGYHVTVTTPYVLTQATKTDWTAYLNRAMLDMAGQDESQRLYDFLKYGSWTHHWNEFVFQSYHHHQHDAIFLAGIPDVKGSLPHASKGKR